MNKVLMFDHSKKDMGLHMRTITQGEEWELVKAFIDYYIHNFLKNNKVNNLAVFVEPKIASGFPDIVFVSYSPAIMDNWSSEREKLTINDLKVMIHLIMKKGCTANELLFDLSLSKKITIQSIEKLLDANMIRYSQGLWKPAEMKKIYNIKKIVTIEAKMSNMKKVAEQTLINTWFASQSYALTSAINPQNSTIKSFENQGIGLYCKNQGFKKVVEAPKLKLPSSYLSLQFNEWIGKTVAHLY